MTPLELKHLNVVSATQEQGVQLHAQITKDVAVGFYIHMIREGIVADVDMVKVTELVNKLFDIYAETL